MATWISHYGGCWVTINETFVFICLDGEIHDIELKGNFTQKLGVFLNKMKHDWVKGENK